MKKKEEKPATAAPEPAARGGWPGTSQQGKEHRVASYKMNIASIKGCPDAKKFGALLADFGVPEKEEFGVLAWATAPASVTATILRKSLQSIQKMDARTKEITTEKVEKVTLYPFFVKPSTERLEVYSGSKAAIEQVSVFFSSCLCLATVVEACELDVLGTINTLTREQAKFQLKAVKVSDYAANSYMLGAYGPKFIDSEHGREFLEKYAEAVTSASVRFYVNGHKANVTLRPNACLSYSCDEDMQQEIQEVVRKLV